MKISNNKFFWLIFLLLILATESVFAADSKTCHGRFIDPISDVCWSCLFPLSLGDLELYSGDHPDTKNPKNPFCLCSGTPPKPGIALGYWEPIALVDVTRHPFCLVNLNGVELNLGNYGEGRVNTNDPNQNDSFYHVHWYIFPLIHWLNLLGDVLCLETAEFDIAYLTELDPTWNDDELTFILNPEAILFAHPITQLACAADAIAATKNLPLDFLFWCAGAQGSMYPLNGSVQEHVGGVQASTLLAERMTYKLHREGLLWDSGIKDDQLCSQHLNFILPKSRYRYQMTAPLPTAKEPKGCNPFGHSTAVWGAKHEYPYQGEDFGYLIWRKRNCCAF
jgi:conjugal transfer pilus assembly protein TraU